MKKHTSAWCWTPNEQDKKRLAKQDRQAKNQKELRRIGSHWNRPNVPGQLIGKPGGTGAGKRLSIPTLPVMRHPSVG